MIYYINQCTLLLQEKLFIIAGPLPNLANYFSVEFRNFHLHFFSLGQISHTQARMLLVKSCHIHYVIDIVVVSPLFNKINDPYN